jgi:hypothetical protein
MLCRFYHAGVGFPLPAKGEMTSRRMKPSLLLQLGNIRYRVPATQGKNRGRGLMKQLVLITSLLLCTPIWAQTYSNASLHGKYSFQLSHPSNANWSKTVPCPTNASITATGGSFLITTVVGSGVMTFNGAGSFSATFTEIGHINQSASNNTVKITFNSSCQVVSVNNGSIVYQSATAQTGTGTYAVQSNGTGAITLVGSSKGLILRLAGSNSAGLSSTALLNSPATGPDPIQTGIAVHQ